MLANSSDRISNIKPKEEGNTIKSDIPTKQHTTTQFSELRIFGNDEILFLLLPYVHSNRKKHVENSIVKWKHLKNLNFHSDLLSQQTHTKFRINNTRWSLSRYIVLYLVSSTFSAWRRSDNATNTRPYKTIWWVKSKYFSTLLSSSFSFLGPFV